MMPAFDPNTPPLEDPRARERQLDEILQRTINHPVARKILTSAALMLALEPTDRRLAFAAMTDTELQVICAACAFAAGVASHVQLCTEGR